MALTSPHKSPSTEMDTPTPYRLSTSAVIIWEPRQPTTAEHSAIRDQIEPRSGWWQCEFKPWHIATIFTSYGVSIAAFVTYAALHGLGR